MKNELCRRLVKRGCMSRPRPCLRPCGHQGHHTPDLQGMRFGNLRVLKIGKPLGARNQIAWDCIDTQGRFRPSIWAHSLIHGEARGLQAPDGTGYTDRDGYHIIHAEGKQFREHRYVMSKMLGRPLRSDEIVHHGPKGRACNIPENLHIRLKGNHPAGHSEQEVAAWLQSLGWVVEPPKNRRIS